MSVFDCNDEQTRAEGLEAAKQAINDGKLVVLPTDTVYGIGADAFNHDAVKDLLAAKGRGPAFPPPVLVGTPAVLHALGCEFSNDIERLVEEFWPGPLTVIVKSQPSLAWDLGETRGTVALRMPNHPVTLELLRETGPLAVSSANRHGKDAAVTIMDAATQLGDNVEVYLDAGKSAIGEASTIIDATVTPPEIVRPGALSQEEIVEKIGDIFADPEAEETVETVEVEAVEAEAIETAEPTEGAELAVDTAESVAVVEPLAEADAAADEVRTEPREL